MIRGHYQKTNGKRVRRQVYGNTLAREERMYQAEDLGRICTRNMGYSDTLWSFINEFDSRW